MHSLKQSLKINFKADVNTETLKPLLAVFTLQSQSPVRVSTWLRCSPLQREQWNWHLSFPGSLPLLIWSIPSLHTKLLSFESCWFFFFFYDSPLPHSISCQILSVLLFTQFSSLAILVHSSFRLANYVDIKTLVRGLSLGRVGQAREDFLWSDGFAELSQFSRISRHQKKMDKNHNRVCSSEMWIRYAHLAHI